MKAKELAEKLLENPEFEIAPYYSVPHGYTSIKYEGILLFIPDDIFNEHLVEGEVCGYHLN